ncbi:MAG: ABC transporter permease [Anaerolineae bacterium]|nr:ABC transporter permease [Anaerolineae bacterium]
MTRLPVLRFLLQRAWTIAVTLLIVTALIYGTICLAPLESRVRLYMGKRTRSFMPPEIEKRLIETIIREHGMDDPFPVQYVRWATRMIQGEWGWSPTLRADVLDVLLKRTPATVELTLYSLLLFIPLGLVCGAVAGWRRGRAPDRGFRLSAYVATSIPPFILGLVLLSIFYVGLHWFLPGYLSSSQEAVTGDSSFRTITGLLTIDGLLNGQWRVSLDAARHLALPVVTLSLFHWATLGRITRALIIEEANKGYITAAHARGLTSRRVLWGHAVPNVLAPSLTSSALSAAALITGVYIVEVVFNWPGVSKLITRTYWEPDVVLAAGFAVYSVLAVLAVMILLDIVQLLADPRLRGGGEGS